MIKEKLPESTVTAILIHIFIGWGFLRLSALSITHLRYNGYLSLILALVMVFPVAFIAADFVRLHPGEDMSSLFKRAFGTIIGSFCTFSVWAWLTLVIIFIVRESHLMIVTYFFKTTSLTLIISLFCGICLYLALHGLRACGRLAGFVLIPPLLIIYTLLIIGLFNMNPLNIRPILAGSIRQWLAGGWDMVFIVVPTGAILFYLPFIDYPRPNRIMRVEFKILLVVIPLFFLSILGTLGSFGDEVLSKMAWPNIEFFHIIDYPFLLLEQAGLLFLLAWYGFVVVTVGQGFFHIGYLLKRLVPRIPLHWCIASSGILAFILSILPVNTITLDSWVEKARGISNIYFLSLFATTWVIIRLKAGRKEGAPVV